MVELRLIIICLRKSDMSPDKSYFKIVVEKYHKLKAAIRSGVKAVTQEAATQTQGPDIEKLKEELRKEVKKEFQKKVNLLTAVSKSDLNE